MHVVTGGAYNGKSAWVRQHYLVDDSTDYHWLSAYQSEPCPDDLSVLSKNIVVCEGVEQWVLQWIENQSITEVRTMGRGLIAKWLDWEQTTAQRKLVIIGSDISKGIVPVESKMRTWRDVTGWFYQDLVKQCDRLDLIWYGINKQLK
ncbi:hypothetical protein CFK37_06595 [Virgibacillus phasianinus]|uniref:Uncharacterized protein n=1 Tax=Virgibacillus phasianinus TaxID=2017483 RepID=A0A220U198_9BACI|nr:bifunctional adenosylcobinamide kinase/adenosylcobinamide-phosphate guanylyltransferase [Virgibacillus phasianinus]ASK61850.1 hypothetical protein CFK37_06595 [Virgibacillus phasianinus]